MCQKVSICCLPSFLNICHFIGRKRLTFYGVPIKATTQSFSIAGQVVLRLHNCNIFSFFALVFSCACLVIIKANSALTSVELISRIRSKIHGNFTYGIFTQNQLTLLVKADHIVVTKIGNYFGGVSQD
jgi:hypothetical protein